jgi:hypothetical protein
MARWPPAEGPVPSMRIASPERWWRAGSAPLFAGLLGWAGLPRAVAPSGRIIVTCLAVAAGLYLAARIMRTHLTVGVDGLADHRMFRVVRVPWQQISGFEVDRPRALWGGFCVTAVYRDGTTVDLMSTRAYSRVPSARHLDELHRICRSLEEAAAIRAE